MKTSLIKNLTKENPLGQNLDEGKRVETPWLRGSASRSKINEPKPRKYRLHCLQSRCLSKHISQLIFTPCIAWQYHSYDNHLPYFFSIDPAATQTYTLSLHDALPI